MRVKLLATIFVVAGAANMALASGDFTFASCKGWGGTEVKRNGTDTATAIMRGVVTTTDFQEYCERDPGGEPIPHRGALTVAQCIAESEQGSPDLAMTTEANCSTGQLKFHYDSQPVIVKFPLRSNADVSCTLGMPPLINQLKLTCSASVSGMSQVQSASEFVRSIYGSFYMNGHKSGVPWNDASIRRYYEPKLAGRMISSHNTSPEGGPILDGDPFVNAQEFEISSLKILPEKRSGSHTAVTAIIVNLGKPTTISFDLVPSGDDWKIYDVSGIRHSFGVGF